VDLNTSISDIEEIYHQIVEKLAAAIEFDTGTIQLLEGDVLHVVAQHGFERSPAVQELRFPLDNRFPNARVVQTKLPLALADIRNDFPHFFLEDGDYLSGAIRSWLGVPIIDRGEVWGMVTLDRNRVDPFSPEDIELATAIANHSGVAISNARLYEGLQRANAIQTTLMQELHHRVKNNMQLISSLISIRSAGFGSETQELLGEIRTRILALAAVHESLYRSPDLDIIDLADYLSRVIEEIEMGYRPGAQGVALRTVVSDEIRLHIDQAIPLGLLVSELVLNAVKHAFPPESLGKEPAGTAEITLAACRTEDGGLDLSVEDNGIGPGEIDVAEHDSFGMVLIRTLCEQLDAEITLGEGESASVFGSGTRWKLHIVDGGRK
jgi:two-component sensor histidine kinase